MTVSQMMNIFSAAGHSSGSVTVAPVRDVNLGHLRGAVMTAKSHAYQWVGAI